MALLDPHLPQSPQPRSCSKTLALAGGQTALNCLLTVTCQLRRAAAPAPGEAVYALARAEVQVAAPAWEEVAVVASQPAP